MDDFWNVHEVGEREWNHFILPKIADLVTFCFIASNYLNQSTLTLFYMISSLHCLSRFVHIANNSLNRYNAYRSPEK